MQVKIHKTILKIYFLKKKIKCVHLLMELIGFYMMITMNYNIDGTTDMIFIMPKSNRIKLENLTQACAPR